MLITLAMTTTTTNRIKIKFIFTTIVMMHFIYLKQTSTRPPDTNIPLFFHILLVARWYKRLILLKMLLILFFLSLSFYCIEFCVKSNKPYNKRTQK